ncbi:MAG: uroporphyrinogen methyltransferase / synthase [Clostridia bacterium]|jgi:uroporphyrinogen III methyltransferase/synthase|nr:uroporphyrinogen methyltransferase / synthase [Clostridia bacterium]MDN5323461.1 uroporphyrinogen methyltransferase / synthase [Clostridia bacterium]
MNRGKVFLIGAGPGDIKLITVKGLECIKKADVIVYDRLANTKLLSYKKPDAELIYVGKSPDRHTLTQKEINDLLVREALAGKIVARLKGGDPFVFGRGGEEAEVLIDAHIPFEVVPGITSAISVPAYAGIPVTHRDFTSTFTIITGNEDPTKEDSNINWQRLASDPGTLIFLMGVGNLPNIVQQLIKNGKDKNTPVALIRWGTRPEQQVVSGILANIVEEVTRAGLKSPAIIIVGEVVKLRERLKWFENKPLFGKRVLVTRSREQASILSQRIEELGGEAWEYPTIAIEPPLDFEPFDKAIKNVNNYHWIIFTSVNGVKAFFERLKKLHIDIRKLGDVKLCAIGPKTKEQLEEKGLLVDFVPEEFRAEAIIDGLKNTLKAGQKVLLPRADLARPILVESLKELKLNVEEVIAYRTVLDSDNNKELLEKLINKEIHVITFTSSSTVKNFLKLLGEADIKNLLNGITIACIGPITAETAQKSGLNVDIIAQKYTIEGLVDALTNYFKH